MKDLINKLLHSSVFLVSGAGIGVTGYGMVAHPLGLPTMLVNVVGLGAFGYSAWMSYKAVSGK